MTYAELKGLNPINWRQALIDVKRKDVGKLADLHSWATNWPTCACGNQCALLPRKEDGTPLDKELVELGSKFAIEITYMRYFHDERGSGGFDGFKAIAIETLDKIESRVAVLMAEAHSRVNEEQESLVDS